MLFSMIVAAFLIAAAGVCTAVMDKISFHFSNSIFADFDPLFWYPNESWKNKWKNGDPKQGERFLLSSSVFVWTTDAWHLFKTIGGLCLAAAFATLLFSLFSWQWLAAIAGFRIVSSGAFHLFFHKIFEKNARIQH